MNWREKKKFALRKIHIHTYTHIHFQCTQLEVRITNTLSILKYLEEEKNREYSSNSINGTVEKIRLCVPPREMIITFFPFNMQRGIKRYNKLKKENIITTLVFNHYFYVFVNMTKINKKIL